jgi:uncharacterized small protein (DUF1192 family)
LEASYKIRTLREWQIMAVDPEDLEPRKKQLKPKDLDLLGVEELEAYIAELQAEIERVRAKLAAKKAYLSAAAGFFKP